MDRFISALVLTVVLASVIVVGNASAADCPYRTEEILGDDGVLNTDGEVFVYSIHRANALIRCSDDNLNGKVDAGTEANKLAMLINEQVTNTPEYRHRRDNYAGPMLMGQPLSIADLNTEQLNEAEQRQQARDGKERDRSVEGLYIANSRFDLQNYSYAENQKAQLKGASISYIDNMEKGTRTGKLKGAVGYRFNISNFRDEAEAEQPESDKFYDVFVAPRISFDGEINNAQSETSSLIAAMDTGFSLSGFGPFQRQFFLISPYFQTDFEFEAEAYGLEASWEPRDQAWRLGGFTPGDTSLPKILDGYWRLSLEADALSVNKAGQTKLTDNTDYVWLGGTVAAYWQPYQNYFSDKNYSPFGIFAYSHYWDATSGNDIGLADLTLGLNIDKKKQTAITLNYKNGTQKSDLNKKDEINIGFNIKY